MGARQSARRVYIQPRGNSATVCDGRGEWSHPSAYAFRGESEDGRLVTAPEALTASSDSTSTGAYMTSRAQRFVVLAVLALAVASACRKKQPESAPVPVNNTPTETCDQPCRDSIRSARRK